MTTLMTTLMTMTTMTHVEESVPKISLIWASALGAHFEELVPKIRFRSQMGTFLKGILKGI